MNQIPQTPDVSVANSLANSSTGATNATAVSEQGSSTTPSTAPSTSTAPSESWPAPNPSTPATTTSQASAGSSATSVSPSKASYQVSLFRYSMHSDLVVCIARDLLVPFLYPPCPALTVLARALYCSCFVGNYPRDRSKYPQRASVFAIVVLT